MGLNFLLNSERALLLTSNFAVFMSTPIISPILSKYSLHFRASERGGPSSNLNPHPQLPIDDDPNPTDQDST